MKKSDAVSGDDGMDERAIEILDVAAQAFTERGYEATTIDYIGGVLGVTKGSIYYHYRSKADLYIAVAQRVMDLNFQAMRPIFDDASVAPLERLHRMAHVHALQVMTHLAYQRLAVQGLEAQLMERVNESQRTGLGELIQRRDQYQYLFESLMLLAIEQGQLPAQDTRIAVKTLFGALNWTTMWYRPRPNETEEHRERIAAQLARFVVAGLVRSYTYPTVETSVSDTAD